MSLMVKGTDRCMIRNELLSENQRLTNSNISGLQIGNALSICKHHLNGVSPILARWLFKINLFISTMYFVKQKVRSRAYHTPKT